MVRELDVDRMRAAIKVLLDRVSELGGLSRRDVTHDHQSMFLCESGVLLRWQRGEAVEAGFGEVDNLMLERPLAFGSGILDLRPQVGDVPENGWAASHGISVC